VNASNVIRNYIRFGGEIKSVIDEEKSRAYLAIDNSRRWCKAVIIQSHRIIELNKELSVYFERMKDFTHFQVADKDNMDHVTDLIKIEEYNLIISLNKALEWLAKAKLYFPEVEVIIERINNYLPHIKEVRNMREHEIDYYKNKGHKQDFFVRPLGNSLSDATSTIVNEDGYFLGGRINVQVANKVFNENYIELKELLDKLWRM